MKKYILMVVALLSMTLTGCSGFLDQDPDGLLPDDVVFKDMNLIKSALSNLYARVTLGQHTGGDTNDYAQLDEAVRHDRDEIRNFDRNKWRVYEYTLIRNINQFMEGIKTSPILNDTEKAELIGEARFIRAWIYFCTVRSLGGVPIVGDDIYDYTPGMDLATLQFPRSSESEVYDYIIKECNEISTMLPSKTNTYSARANKWAAKMLEARAALYAASLAKYNITHPNLTIEGGIIGIDANKATGYFETALAAADEVLKNSPYSLQGIANDRKARNFYEAVSIKSNNTEVIWSRDYELPISRQWFTKDCIPRSLAGESTSCHLSVLLNLVEEFEPIDALNPGQGAKFDIGTIENPVFYDTPSELFDSRDPRLGGTVLYPGSFFRGNEIVLQAGQLVKSASGKWEKRSVPFNEMGKTYVNGKLVTSTNGPIMSNDREVNKTGFTILKFLEESESATTFTGSDTWSTYFRIAEAYLIAAEVLVETGKADEALPYINQVRKRAGVQPLATVTFDNIVHERRVEFAFEDHRYWDMKRWRLADEVWNRETKTAERRGLYPYLVVAPGDPDDGKWFFEEVSMSFLYPNNLHFEDRNYYSEIDQDWINKNPKLKKNPYQ